MPLSKNQDVLYYFHGLTENSAAWVINKRALAVQKWWRDRGYDAPTVVAISFGPAWLLSSKNSGRYSGLYDVVVNTLMPKIENLMGGIRGRRLLMGESMGGFNATQLVLKNPELFDRVALGCPAMAELSPFSPWKDIFRFIQRNKASVIDVINSVLLASVFFPKPDDWIASSPFEQGVYKLGPQTPPLYISIGMQDQFGFEEGAAAFAQTAIRRGVKNVTWDPISGRHCSMNTDAVAEFLQPIDR